MVLVILIVGHVQSQSVEQLLAQAKATESIENLLADAVVEKSEDSFANPEENLVKLMRSKTSTTSTTTEPPISNRRRLLFRPRDEQRTKFFNRGRTPSINPTRQTTTTSRQPSILFVIYECFLTSHHTHKKKHILTKKCRKFNVKIFQIPR